MGGGGVGGRWRWSRRCGLDALRLVGEDRAQSQVDVRQPGRLAGAPDLLLGAALEHVILPGVLAQRRQLRLLVHTALRAKVVGCRDG